MDKHYYKNIRHEIENKGFTIKSEELDRPWGAFFVIDQKQIKEFADKFFTNLNLNSFKENIAYSPKILIVKPKSKLSWQYHKRREEIWQVYRGSVGVILSDDDEEKQLEKLAEGEQIEILQEIRHRIIGLEDYGIIAEIWRHTNKQLSDENDIIRLKDDYNR